MYLVVEIKCELVRNLGSIFVNGARDLMFDKKDTKCLVLRESELKFHSWNYRTGHVSATIMITRNQS